MKTKILLLFAALIFSSQLIADSETYTREIKVENPRMNGDDVKAVQQRLLNLDYYEVETSDGWYGPKSANGIKNFQELNGLKQTGIVNETTWENLFNNKLVIYKTRVFIPDEIVIGFQGYLMGGIKSSGDTVDSFDIYEKVAFKLPMFFIIRKDFS